VLHLHHLNHVQIDRLAVGVHARRVGGGRGGLDGQHRVDDVRSELLREGRVELGGEGGEGDGD
jgi:hypothetical protein